MVQELDITYQMDTLYQLPGKNLQEVHKLYINIGDAKADKPSLPSPGMKIDHLGFVVESEKFKEFLVALGFKTA